MTELKQLSEDELTKLHSEVMKMRDEVLALVQKYDFDANSLVSKTFQKAIETEFGRKYFKRITVSNKGSTGVKK